MRVPATPWVQNVITRLLGMRGASVPQSFAPELRAIFDISRRDPELLKEMGFVPWGCQVDQPAVAAQFGVAEVTPLPGYIVVLEWRTSENGLAAGTQALWSSAALQAPIAVQNIYARDSRIGVDVIGGSAGLQINAATLLAIPAANLSFEFHGETTDVHQSDSPVVLTATSPRTFRIVKRTANAVFQPTLWGYSLKTVP